MAAATEIGTVLARAPPLDRAGLSSSRHLSRTIPVSGRSFCSYPTLRRGIYVRSSEITEKVEENVGATNGALLPVKLDSSIAAELSDNKVRDATLVSNPRRKTKIVCTIGPSTSSRDMIWKLAEAGMNVARLNMSHGDHQSHQKTIDLVKEYNAQSKDNIISIMLDTKGPEVRSGDLPKPIMLEGQEFNFTSKEESALKILLA